MAAPEIAIRCHPPGVCPRVTPPGTLAGRKRDGEASTSNPFSEVADGDAEEAELVQLANNGDRITLEKLVLRHQAWIDNVAVRMVSGRDVEGVLVKVITRLGTFKGESRFRTWL